MHDKCHAYVTASHDIHTAKKGTCRWFATLVVQPLLRLAMLPEAVVPGRQQERFAAELKLTLEGGYGVLRNVSANGVYFVTDVALREGQPVTFRMDFPNFPSGPISVNCIARIVRVEEQGAKKGVAAEISSFEFRRIPETGESSGNKE